MATITIEKRTRVLIDDEWGVWSVTTDVPPYTNTDLIEYRVGSDADVTAPNTAIDIEDMTNNVTTDSNNVVTGDGYFDNVMETITKHLDAQYQKNILTGDNYARVYSQQMGNVLGQSYQFMLNKRAKELQTDALAYDNIKKEEEAIIAQSTRYNKINQVNATLLKTYAETDYIAEQETQLVNSVEYNNKIKVMETLGDTYGTAMAGGLTVSNDQWEVFYNLGSDVANSDVPTSISISKVT